MQAAEAEVTALQAEGLVDISVPVGGSVGPALRQAFYRLLEQVSLQYPQAVPMAQVWGYGWASWDLDYRQYGQKPFRSACSGHAGVDSAPCATADTIPVPALYRELRKAHDGRDSAILLTADVTPVQRYAYCT